MRTPFDIPPLLKEIMPEFSFENPTYDPEQLREFLVANMETKDGLGLAANQVGLRIRAFVMSSQPPIILFNPKIVESSSDTSVMREGCLSFPGFFVRVKRPNNVTVEYQNIRGDVVSTVFGGVTGRVFQHEIDHLDGIVFWERASRYHYDKAVKEYRGAA